MSLLRDNATALYRQIAERLRRDIANERFGAVGRLPSEAEIGARFKVSRVTVRLALHELEREGLIDRKKGKGTFASGKKVRHELATLRSFHETILKEGLHATMQIKSIKTVDTPDTLREFFGPRRPSCVLLQRLHLVDGEPIALGKSYLPIKEEDLSNYDIGKMPTYSILTNLASKSIVRASIEVGAVNSNAEISRSLKIRLGSTLLTMERTSFFAGKECAEKAVFFIRPERYKFVWNAVFIDEVL